MKKGNWGYKRVLRAFGNDLLSSDGEIDREKLASKVFKDANLRRIINRATHLPIFLELFRQILVSWLQLKTMVVVDMPLLYETSSHKLMSTTVVVACSHEQQVARMMRRDVPSRTKEEAEARIAAQLPLVDKIKKADVVIDNSGDEIDLEPQLERLFSSLETKSRLVGWLTSPLAAAALLGGICFLMRFW